MADSTRQSTSPSPRTADQPGASGAESLVSSSSLETSIREAQEALRARPRVSLRRRLGGSFLLWLLGSLGLAVVSVGIVARIRTKVAFMETATSYSFEIQQARRFEKNYFLYGTGLADVQVHIDRAQAILDQAGDELAMVIGREDFELMARHLRRYRELLDQLAGLDSRADDSAAERLHAIEEELRTHGAEMVAVAENLVAKERQAVNSMLAVSQRIPVAFMAILVLLMLYLAAFVSKQILAPLKRMVGYSRRIARGDFTPITPRKKYHDEFSELAVAMNHMMLQLAQRQDLLVRAHKLKAVGTLTAGVAHELNNPLNNIILTASMLEEDFHDMSADECLELVRDLVSESERARKIVRNLLDFARESEGEMEALRIDQIVEDTLRLAGNQIKLAKVKVEGQVEENLPPVYGDRQQLEQVFLNLVLNALDAMPQGGRLRIHIGKSPDRESVAVRIEDTGVGIPKQRLQEIFDPFFTSKKSKGTGLGLSVSLGIVQRYGGDIHVESEVGKGSAFTVLLPVTKVPADIANPFERDNAGD
ncbi:MAG TPA: sensor histidine kinase [Planctomycetaceae bacterium]|nr:sensor histidine kinase [Planctomycetaceae bacterium]